MTNSSPSLWKLIDGLKKEESLADLKMVHVKRGDHLPRAKKYKSHSEQIKKLVINYNPNQKVAFLRSIAHNLTLQRRT